MTKVLAALAVVGFLLPVSQFVPFFRNPDLASLFATPITTMFTLDLLVSCTAFWVFAYVDGARRGVRHRWMYVAMTLLVGLSFALPMYLLARERTNEVRALAAAAA